MNNLCDCDYCKRYAQWYKYRCEHDYWSVLRDDNANRRLDASNQYLPIKATDR